MKRTAVSAVIGLILAGGVLGYLIEIMLQSFGGAMLIPPMTLSVTLIVIAAAIIGLAIPVRRRVTGKRKAPLSPFYATRVAVLAKSGALAGSLLLGWAAGILIYVLGRPIAPSGGQFAAVIVQAVSSLILVIAALIAERMCTLPPDEPEEDAAHGNA